MGYYEAACHLATGAASPSSFSRCTQTVRIHPQKMFLGRGLLLHIPRTSHCIPLFPTYFYQFVYIDNCNIICTCRYIYNIPKGLQMETDPHVDVKRTSRRPRQHQSSESDATNSRIFPPKLRWTRR